MFNFLKRRELARIAELEAHIANLQTVAGKTEAERRVAESNARALSQSLRQIDEDLYRISQCSDWNTMRPYISNLVEGMTVRKRAESDRITGIIYNEIYPTIEVR